MRKVWISLAAAAVLASSPSGGQVQTGKTCLAFVADNLAKGGGNWYCYYYFADNKLTIKPGDVLEYRVLLDPANPLPKGGVDVEFGDGGDPLRDMGLDDENGVRAHGDGTLNAAVGHWLTRRIHLDRAAGRTTTGWKLDFEGDAFGEYVQFVNDVRVVHADGTATTIYAGGQPKLRRLDDSSGYTKHPVLLVVNESSVESGAGFAALRDTLKSQSAQWRKLDDARQDLQMAREFLAKNPNPELEQHIKEAAAMLEALDNQTPTAEKVQAVLHATQHAMSHAHPVMEKYTGHLVGHAHIDLQWLWEWQEGVAFTHDTFNQAVKFMDEFPGFTFSQSSSCLYQATEEHYPDLFKKIQKKVANGQWELVGGRVCEGDTNMISAESHARHFLYGQRYFREKFGKSAIVGWEPDTFGHTAQMPQILKNGGCDYYYFCRGGKNKPLFWWTGLDGTKVLAFDEPATGSWYNSDLSYQQFRELLDFETKTGGAKDTLWVYGVGNHGGGPTREHIEEALKWMKSGTKPNVKFSTATQFFHALEKYDLTKIPTVHEELNPVFDGCYTSHAEIKRANRDAEAETTSAEAVASIASLRGFAYPYEAFRRNWEDICFNHHHDTLPGSGIHAPYDRTTTVLNRVMAEDKVIETKALETLALSVTPVKGGVNVLAFNPTGHTRSGWVETYLVKSGFDGEPDLNPASTVAVAPNGDEAWIEPLNTYNRRVRFWAKDIPAFGYRTYHMRPASKPRREFDPQDLTIYSNGNFELTFDAKRGCISHLRLAGKEYAGLNGLGLPEAHWENAGGMSAWVMGKIDRHEALRPTLTAFGRYSNGQYAEFRYEIPPSRPGMMPTQITQKFIVDDKNNTVRVEGTDDWQAIGGDGRPAPTLRIAFDGTAALPTLTHEIPFGALVRPMDGTEWPALKWADLSDATGGISVINDSKHGQSGSGTTMRMTVIRSSFDPDPMPNPGVHHWSYEIVPHKGTWKDAHINQRAIDFNQPLLVATVPFDAKGTQPLEYAPLSVDPQIVVTALKRAEDKDGLVLRMYEGTGKPFNGLIQGAFGAKRAAWTNFIEDIKRPANLKGDGVTLDVHRFEIANLKFQFAAEPKLAQTALDRYRSDIVRRRS